MEIQREGTILRLSTGGTGLRQEEFLVRIVSHLDELRALLSGGLSCTQVSRFNDQGEGTAPAADQLAANSFWGGRVPVQHAVSAASERHAVESSYVSCWHRVSAASSPQRLVDGYTVTDKPAWAVVTRVSNLSQSFGPHSGSERYLDVFPVRYLESESVRLMEARNGEPPRSWFPALEFKRAQYQWEAEARFVLVDRADLPEYRDRTPSPGLFRPRWRYAAMGAPSFVHRVWPLDEYSATQIATLPEPLITLVRLSAPSKTRVASLTAVIASLCEKNKGA